MLARRSAQPGGRGFFNHDLARAGGAVKGSLDSEWTRRWNGQWGSAIERYGKAARPAELVPLLTPALIALLARQLSELLERTARQRSTTRANRGSSGEHHPRTEAQLIIFARPRL